MNGAGSKRRLIERPRLLRTLDRAPARTIALVAPAGYGKTILARQWLARSGRSSAWYDADVSASDVVALAEGLASAVEHVLPGVANTMRSRARLSDGSGTDAATLAELLASEIDEWPRDAWIAIDDYHRAMDAPSSEHFIDRFREASAVNLLLISRRRPTWATPRRILYGEVFEIGKAQLAMDSDETSELLAIGRADPLPGLIGLAEGWPAVIGLASLARKVDLPDDAVADELYGFLAEEVFRGIDAISRSGLAALSNIPSISDESARVALGEHAEHVLREGIAAGVLSPPRRDRYELHPLWREFLLTRSPHPQPELDRDQTARLRDLYLAHRSWDEAFTVASAGRNPLADMEVVLINEMDDLLDGGRLATLEEHVRMSRLVGSTPVADLADAEIRFRRGDHSSALMLARRASASLPDHHPLASRASFRAAQAAYLADEVHLALEIGARAERIARQLPDRANAAYVQYLAAIELESELVDDLARRVQEASVSNPDHALRAASTTLLRHVRLGAVPDAVSMASDAACFVDDATDPLIRTAFLNMLGRSWAYQMEYKRAIEFYEVGLRDVTRMRLDFAAAHFHLGLANAHIGQANFTRAEQSLRCAREFASDAHTIGNWHLVTARLALAQHKYLLARRVLRQAGTAKDAATRAEVCAYSALAEACLGRRSAALALVDETGTISGTIEPAVVSSIARLLVLPDQRDRLLGELVELVDARGHPDFVLHACRTYPAVAVALADARVSSPAVDAAVAYASVTASSVLQTLTPREREILELVADGLRNREIASRLYISELTVKAHVRHILDKTGTRSRTEAAVLVANELGAQ